MVMEAKREPFLTMLVESVVAGGILITNYMVKEGLKSITVPIKTKPTRVVKGPRYGLCTGLLWDTYKKERQKNRYIYKRIYYT